MVPLLLLLLACDADDACDAMCDASLATFDACLEPRGLEWGDMVGYADAADYANWCGTWAWEARLLGTEDACADMLPEVSSGDCDAYTAAWAAQASR
jgi:hypothetical protein